MNITNITDVLNLINDESFVSDHFNNKNYTTTTNESYKIIGYNKPVFKVESYGLIRSMIINSSNKVVCFSPSKALPHDQFIKKYAELNENIIAEEFVEGTMINVFWTSDKWEFATRNTVGAEVFFYKTAPIQKTFKTMFLEAAKENNLDIELLDKTLCYSFILQHPGNRIVIPFTSPQLYLIAVYEIIYANDSTNSIFIHQKKRELNQTTLIKTPQNYSFNSYEELNQYANMNTSYKIMGVMIHNCTTGERCKLRNPSYEQVRNLKGNHANLQYQYLSLRQNRKLSSFLHYYPEHSKDFNYFKDNLHLFTNALYQNYISCYIKKEKPLLEYPEEYRTNMFNLHQKYLNELKLVNSYISKSVVIDYVNNMPIGLQMYLLNYNVSKRYLDFYKINFPALKN